MKPHFFPEKLLELSPFTEHFVARRVESEKADVYFASYPAGTVIDEHDHDTDNYGVITKGRLVLIVDGVESEYGVGDWYHVARHVSHAARFDEDTAEIEIWFK